MKRTLFFLSLVVFATPTLHARTCRPIANTARCGLPFQWGSYQRYNRCCLNEALYIIPQFGGYRLDAPGYNYGEVLASLTGVGEFPISEFTIDRDRVTAFYPRLTAGVEMINCWTPCWVGSSIFFEVSGSYLTNDKFLELGNGEFANFALPRIDGGGDFIAETSDVLTEFSGVDFQRRYRYGNLAFRLGSSFLIPTSPKFSFVPYMELDFNYLFQGYRDRVASIVGGANATHFLVSQSLSTRYYDFGIGVSTGYAFLNSCRTPYVFADATGFCSGVSTRLKGNQHATFPLIGPEFVHMFRKHKTFTGKFRGQAGVGYQFGYNFQVSVYGQVDYWGVIPRIVNPHRIATTPSGTGHYDRPAHIEEKTATNYALVLSLDFKFF